MMDIVGLLTALGQLVIMLLVAYVLLKLAGLIQKIGDKVEKD